MTDPTDIPDSESGAAPEISYEPDQPESDLPEDKPEPPAKADADTEGEDKAAKTEGEPAAPDAEDKTAKDDEPGDDAAAEPAKPKKPSGVQKRIDELTANWRNAERRAERLEDMLAGQITKPPQQDPKPTPAPQPPKQDQFENYDEFLVAKAKFEVTHDLRDEITQDVQKRLEAERQERDKAFQDIRAQEANRQYQARADKARSRYDDYDDVVNGSNVGVTDTMTEVILQSENGPDLVYHLGANPDLAARITALDPLAQARELGRLEEIISRPAPKKTTAAPKPPKTVTKGNADVGFDPEKASYADYVKWRMKDKAS